MDKLMERLTATVGLRRDIAGRTIGIILGFLRSDGPADKVEALIDTIPGTEAAIDSAGGSGMIGRWIGIGVKAEIKGVARELFKFGRDRIGADRTGKIVAGTPL